MLPRWKGKRLGSVLASLYTDVSPAPSARSLPQSWPRNFHPNEVNETHSLMREQGGRGEEKE